MGKKVMSAMGGKKQDKGDWECVGGWVVILNKVDRGTCEQRLNGGEKIKYMDIWKKSILGRGYSLCKGPEEPQEDNTARMESVGGEEEFREVTEVQIP